jgi:2-keto-3-deoxy-L-rhamnonate aldolase RhmA
MRGSMLRDKLHSSQPVHGVCMEGIGQARWPKYFADLGVDYVWLESEHSPNNRESLAWAAQLYAALGIAPLVRIPEISTSQAAVTVDLGAHGVIAPYVETVEQVKTLVGAVKYRPLKGEALTAAVDRGESPNPKAYIEAYNADANLIIMVESPTGIRNLPDRLLYRMNCSR